ncbi:MAG: GumC family protein [Candidatus Zixiibacteriota bacterium]
MADTRPTEQATSIELREIVSIVLKRKWLLIIPLVLVAAIAYGGSMFLVPKYRSSTIIWIDRPTNVSRELINLIGGGGRMRQSAEDRARQLAALQNEITSQTYLSQLIQNLHLDNDPAIVQQAAKLRELNPGHSAEMLKLNLLYEHLRGQIVIQFVGEDQIKLTVENTDPVLARDMVTQLAEILELEKTRYELEKILDNQTFADMQLEKMEHDYQAALDSLAAAQRRLDDMRFPANISSEPNRRDILSDIDKARLDRADLRNEATGVNEQLKSMGLLKKRLVYSDSIVELRKEIDEQMSSFAGLMEKYPWNAQNVLDANIRLNENIRYLQMEIRHAVAQQFSELPENQRQLLERHFLQKEDTKILGSRVSRLEASLEKIDERMKQIPRLASEVDEEKSRVTNARRYRDVFKSEETTVGIMSERAKDRTKYRIIEPARIAVSPFWPDRTRILMIGIALGLMVGAAAVFLAELFDNSIRHVKEIEDLLGLKVLAAIPKLDELKTIR